MTGIPAGAKRLTPGFYSHDGEMHIDFEELIRAAGGNPRNPRDRQLAERQVETMAREYGIPVEVRENE